MMLSRRGVSGLAALLAGLGASRAIAAPSTGPKTHRVAMQVSSREGGVFDLALNNAVNLAREYSEQAEELEVEIVAYGPGLHMLRADTSPVTARIHSISESVPGIVLSACVGQEVNVLRFLPAGLKFVVLAGQQRQVFVIER